MKIYILLPVHNRCELTKRFIECLKFQTYRNYHLVLIDDGSTDGTSEMILSSLDNVTIIRGNGTWWWAGALQQGYEWIINNNISKSDAVLIINDDTEFENDFLEKAIRVLGNSQKAFLLSRSFDIVTRVVCETGVHVDWKKLTFNNASPEEEINCSSTRGLFMRVGDMIATGGFYPRILPHYLSDYEYTMRAKRNGIALITDESVRLFVNNDTTGIHIRSINTLSEFMTNFFHKKSSGYIISWISFVVLCAPTKFVVINLLRILYSIIFNLLRVIAGYMPLRNSKTYK